MEKINLKNLYQLFKYAKSHGIVSLHFLCLLGVFLVFDPLSQNALTELYQNLSYETLSRTRNHKFESVCDFISELSFFINRSTLANIIKKEEGDKEVLERLKKHIILLKNLTSLVKK